jgi:RNA polymerase sigma factor (sigma-70 family)
VDNEQQRAAFDAWIAGHAAILHHAVNGFAEGPDREDLMQEVLLAVWRSIPAFRGDSKPATYIYRISHNAAMTWRRKQSRQWRSDRIGIAIEQLDPAIERIYEAIRMFPPLDRSLLLLHLDEMSYADIAAIHGISENLVGVRLTRARQKLIQTLKEDSNGH